MALFSNCFSNCWISLANLLMNWLHWIAVSKLSPACHECGKSVAISYCCKCVKSRLMGVTLGAQCQHCAAHRINRGCTSNINALGMALSRYSNKLSWMPSTCGLSRRWKTWISGKSLLALMFSVSGASLWAQGIFSTCWVSISRCLGLGVTFL